MNDWLENSLQNWIPYRLLYKENEWLCRWLYVNDQPFTDPFFDETIQKCLKFSFNSQRYKCLSDVKMLAEWSPSVDNVQPTAFIFHISRCGSTLVSQSLSMNAKHISLSEVPLFDEILRMPFKNKEADESIVGDTLKAAIQFYGARRNKTETHLFIKTDSWHLLFYKQLRTLFPQTPFVLLYREPLEVLSSHQRQKGMQAVLGLLEPSLLNIDPELLKNVHPDNYIVLVLEKYFQMIETIVEKDNHCLLVNYNEGIAAIMKKIAAFANFELTEEAVTMQVQRSRYHAKRPQEIFCENQVLSQADETNLQKLVNQYEQIDKLRQAIKTPKE